MKNYEKYEKIHTQQNINNTQNDKQIVSAHQWKWTMKAF